jgi:hypothetical protein
VSGRRGRVALERAPSAPTGESRITRLRCYDETRQGRNTENKTMSDEEEIIIIFALVLSSRHKTVSPVVFVLKP